MPERTSVTLSLSAMFLPLPWAAGLRLQVLERLAARAHCLFSRTELLKRVHGGVNDVVRVGRPDALGEDVLHARHFQHVAHRAAGDDAGAFGGRLEQHLAGAELA